MVAANSASADGANLRPFLPSALNDGLLPSGTVTAAEKWDTTLTSLVGSGHLQTTSFSCPADPVGGGRLSAAGCAQYAAEFFTAVSPTTTTVAIPGPPGTYSTTYTPVDRRKYWLGPVVDSLPSYVSAPGLALSDNTYRAFADKSGGYGGRPNVLYVETTDGALHALNPDYKAGGTYTATQEFWTFLPPALNSQIVNNIPAADRTLLDASPIVADTVFSRVNSSGSGTGAADWHTTLVSSFATGGRGFFALDVTQPYPASSFTSLTSPVYPTGIQTNPHFLWQLTTGNSTATVHPSAAGERRRRSRRSTWQRSAGRRRRPAWPSSPAAATARRRPAPACARPRRT